MVEIMLRIAAGEGLPLRQEEVRVRGHAVEARVCAEDAAHDFLPSTGELVEVRFPASGVRVESGVRAGMVVTPYYDSMLAKLIVHAPTRDAALDRLSLALGETRVLGVETNGVFLQRLLALPETRSATFHTRLIDQVLAERTPGAPGAPLSDSPQRQSGLLDARRMGARFGAWSALDVTGWQMHAGDDPLTAIPALLLHSGGRVHEVRFGAVSPESEVTVQVGAERVRLSLTAAAQGDWRLRVGDRHDLVTIVRRGDTLFVQGGGGAHDIGVTSYLSHVATARQASGQLRTPMMGMILKTHRCRRRAGARRGRGGDDGVDENGVAYQRRARRRGALAVGAGRADGRARPGRGRGRVRKCR